VKGVLLVALVVAGGVTASTGAFEPAERDVTLTVRHSRFDADEIRVKRGERIRFVVVNTDPIDHELIVGPMDVQDRHERGTEAEHAPRDGEVSVPLFATRSTSSTFDEAGTYFYGCHLPGHWAYGMRGRIVVL
jgi:plastocyanin